MAIDHGYSLNRVTGMMVILISPHDQILLRLLDTKVTYWLGSFTRNVDISYVLSRLAIFTKTW